MSSPKSPPGRAAPTDKELQALLVRLQCPTPLHALRTLLLGAIASPRPEVSPMAPLAQAWGGELPEFASTAEVTEVIEAFVDGLWNRLSDHQSARNPFRLPRFEVQPTRSALSHLARMRAQELKGFVDGLFGPEDELLLPQKAHEAVVALAELHSLFDGAADLLADETKAAPAQELKALLRNLQQMTIIADEQINKAVQSCRRARGQWLEPMADAMSRPFGRAQFDDDEPPSVDSPLSQTVTRNGVTVEVRIYGDSNDRWILELVDSAGASHVWEEHFETDQQALDEALAALEEEPLEFMGTSADGPVN